MKIMNEDLLLKLFEDEIRKNIKERAVAAALEAISPEIETMVEKAMESLKSTIKNYYDTAKDQQIVKVVTDIRLV